MKRTLVIGLAVLVAAAAASSASAAPKKKKPKPQTKEWTATAAAPDPTNAIFDAASQPTYSVCSMTVPQSFQIEELTVKGAGKLVVDMTNFQGDWDILLLDSKDKELKAAGLINPVEGPAERISYKVKKAGSYQIVLCNWAGGPMADGKYVYTYS